MKTTVSRNRHVHSATMSYNWCIAPAVLSTVPMAVMLESAWCGILWWSQWWSECARERYANTPQSAQGSLVKPIRCQFSGSIQSTKGFVMMSLRCTLQRLEPTFQGGAVCLLGGLLVLRHTRALEAASKLHIFVKASRGTPCGRWLFHSASATCIGSTMVAVDSRPGWGSGSLHIPWVSISFQLLLS